MVCKHEGWQEEISDEYPDGYSRKWREFEIKHYVKKLKEHEARRASTNERQEYWDGYKNSTKTSRD